MKAFVSHRYRPHQVKLISFTKGKNLFDLLICKPSGFLETSMLKITQQKSRRRKGKPEPKGLCTTAARRFADPGRKRMRPKDLEALETSERLSLQGKNHSRERDLLSRAVIRKTRFCTVAIIGMENQSEIHYGMPVRSMLYDAMNYEGQMKTIRRERRNRNKSPEGHDQIPGITEEKDEKLTGAEFLSGLKKDDRLDPVITLVVYWGTEDWDGARDLHGLLKTEDKELLSYIANYRMNLIEPLRMTREDFEKFSTDVRQVFQLIHAANHREQMEEILRTDPAYQSLNREAAGVIREFLSLDIEIEEGEGERINMCKAWEENKRISEEKGRREGRFETAAKLIQMHKLTLEEIAGCADLTLEEVREMERSMGREA